MEFAGEADTGATVATGKAGLLFQDHLPQLLQLFGGGVLHGQLGDGALHQAAGIEDLSRFLDTRAGHYRPAIRPQQHHAFMGETRQGATDDGAADTEDLAQGLLAQLGAGGQALLENGIENVRIDDVVLRAAAGAFGGARLLLEWLQLFVHGGSRRWVRRSSRAPFAPLRRAEQVCQRGKSGKRRLILYTIRVP
ncbi:hypothetical protein D9M68_590510 [compost metagenome]